ncbi:hypothetical protein BY458DRAFT_477418 [Sporodiniella umbellata]|nr:hypothetical protein BY458DRAFT_477418 [Sporodiniella umbellata]
MKTNYNHWVAWYEYCVKPHAITPHGQTTRCSYATTKKPVRTFQLWETQQGNDSNERYKNPRKRQRIEVDLISTEKNSNPFINNKKADRKSESHLTHYSETEDAEYHDAVDINQFLQDTLQSLFGLRHWVPNQLESIRSAMFGKTLFIVMPSGPHRNICYQLPASLQSCVTLVLVPQLIYANPGPIPTLFFTDSPQSVATVSNLDLLSKIHDARLIYITYSHFLKYHSIFFEAKKYISRCVLDEAHHLSQWHPSGHPRYQKAVEALTANFPQIAITALTAISSERIQTDILNFFNTSVEIHKKSVLFS